MLVPRLVFTIATIMFSQANCYCMCLTALHLAQPQYAWVVVPVELEEIMEKVRCFPYN